MQVDGRSNKVIEYTTQEGVQSAIFKNFHQKRFYLVEEALICKGYLREEFGYNATSPTEQAVLNGTHIYSEDFDKATKELCEECACIRLKVPKNSASSHMDCKDLRDHWHRLREETSSSLSCRHFGHYKAGMLLDYITHFQALFATLVMHNGLVIERWACGLSVMLEKIFS
jgi:hypothetical protein